jgi:tRNA A58 N-methylase Trm61
MQDDNWDEFVLDVRDPWHAITLFLTGLGCGIIVTVLFYHF